MAPGTWNAPGENDAVASAGGVAYCRQPKRTQTRLSGAHAVCNLEWGA